MQTKAKALLLDWAGTLSDSLFWGQWQEPTSPNYPLIEVASSHILTESKAVFTDWMRGKYTSEQFVKYLCQQDNRLKYEVMMPALIDSAKTMRMFDGVEPRIKNLRQQGCSVHLITDNTDCFSRWTIPALKLARDFNSVHVSSDYGCLKSDLTADGHSQLLQAVFEEIGSPAHTVFIDDSDCSAPAELLGIEFKQIKRNSTVQLFEHMDKILAFQ